MIVHGNYYVEIEVLNYTNPTGQCRDCQLLGYEWSAFVVMHMNSLMSVVVNFYVTATSLTV